MKSTVTRLRNLLTEQSFWSPLLIVLFTLPVTVPALNCFFTFDDLMNLDYYLVRPLQSVCSNFILFTSLHRPLGSVFYLPLYALFGMDPIPFYFVGILLFSFNVALLYTTVRLITGQRLTALVSASLVGLHPEVHNVLYNFGAVFELTLFSLVIATLFAYSRYRNRESKRSLFYLLSLICFIGALNAKETAVVTPLLLLLYEGMRSSLFRKDWVAVKIIGRDLSPFFLISLPYTAVKLFGSEAYWRDNPQYSYHFDATLLDNHAAYMTLLVNSEVVFSAVTAGVVVLAFLGIAFLLKNRYAVFGVFFGLLSLAPVLPLPRVWGLFLYLPLAGYALAVAALITDIGSKICRLLLEQLKPTTRERVSRLSQSAILRILATLAFLVWLEPALSPSIHRARGIHYQNELSASWKSFASQLSALHPSLIGNATLAFESPPFDFTSHYRWCLNFLVWLNYENRSIRILRVPEEADAFNKSLSRNATTLLFKWEEGELKEIPIGH